MADGYLKITSFMIGILLIGLLASSIAIFISQSNEYYPIEYDNSTFGAYNKMAELSAQINETQEIIRVNISNPQNNIFDIIGGFFGSTWSATKTTWSSLDLFYSIQEGAMEDLSSSGQGVNPVIVNNIKTTTVMIAVVMLIIGLSMYIIFKVII